MRPRTSIISIVAIWIFIAACAHGATLRQFSVKDDIEMVHMRGQVEFSPDGKYFYVLTQHGSIKENIPKYTVWVWSSAQVALFAAGQTKEPPRPVPLTRIASYKDGPMNGMRIQWLADSSGIVYAALTAKGTFRLFRAELKTRRVEALTPEDENVTGYDFQGNDYLYTITSPAILRHLKEESRTVSVRSITGQSLFTILKPEIDDPDTIRSYGYSELWAVVRGRRFRVENRETHQPIHLYVHATDYSTESSFKLSPNRQSVVALVPPKYLPLEWGQYQAPTGYESILRPLFPLSMFGHNQEVDQPFNILTNLIKSYYLIDLSSGAQTPLVNAPSGELLDWNAELQSARWSKDGRALLLSDTFLPLDGVSEQEKTKREGNPCLVRYELETRQISCVLPLVAGLDKKRFGLQDIRFDPQDRQRVVVDFVPWFASPNGKISAVYRQRPDGSWREEPNSNDDRLKNISFEAKIQQSADDPPKLIAIDEATKATHLLWDPNPQFADVAWGEATVIHWKDNNGAEYDANLLKPPGYVVGKRYPLVIQTHGSSPANVFITSGVTTTGFAAREMAGAGMIVVQMGWNAQHFDSSQEGPDQAEAFASLVKKLDQEGLIDPDKIGLIGWSRSVFHTYSTLAAGRPRLAAASVIEGVNFGYWQFLSGVEDSGNFTREAKQVFGGIPFGEGLESWIEHSPIFHLDKVATPLLMLETGTTAVIEDWEPYAALYAEHKPVEMILLPEGSHVESNPQQRLVTQGMTLDWYRFWLKGEEDPDPTKADQYKRWRAMRKLQGQDQQKLGGSDHEF